MDQPAGASSLDELLLSVGYGRVDADAVVTSLTSQAPDSDKPPSLRTGTAALVGHMATVVERVGRDEGCVRLDGDQALAFVRSRHYQYYENGKWRTDPTGDLGRIERQQDFIRRAIREALSKGLLNPNRLLKLVNVAIEPVVPSLTWTGEKLKPEWTAAFLGGKVAYRPRPWLAARMPAFPARAELLARGLALSHGCPPSSPAEPAPDAELSKIGRRLAVAGKAKTPACDTLVMPGKELVGESVPGICRGGTVLLDECLVRERQIH